MKELVSASRTFIFIILLAGLVAPTVSAQSDAFDWTVGSWEGIRRDAASGDEAPMTMTVESVLGGTGLLRQLEIAGERGPYRGLSVQVWDPKREGWIWSYTSEGRGRFAEYHAVTIEGTKSIWRPTEPRTRDSRLTSEWLPTEKIWHRTMEVSEDGGESWQALWVDELRRSPEGATPGNSTPADRDSVGSG